jgi:beta-lactam-binding protein with PASTA domain
MVKVPGVWRMNAERAKTLLEQAGFTVVVNRPPFGLGYDLVAGQTPQGGTVVRYGSVVTITVI